MSFGINPGLPRSQKYDTHEAVPDASRFGRQSDEASELEGETLRSSPRSRMRNRPSRANVEPEVTPASTVENKVHSAFSRLLELICDVKDTFSLALNYENNKWTAIGTGVGSIVALVSALAFAILLVPANIPLIFGLCVATLMLGVISIAHAVKAAKGRAILNDPVKVLENLKSRKDFAKEGAELLAKAATEMFADLKTALA